MLWIHHNKVKTLANGTNPKQTKYILELVKKYEWRETSFLSEDQIQSFGGNHKFHENIRRILENCKQLLEMGHIELKSLQHPDVAEAISFIKLVTEPSVADKLLDMERNNIEYLEQASAEYTKELADAIAAQERVLGISP